MRPQAIEHEEYPHQSNEPEFVEKEGWYHGDAPADGGLRGALSRVFVWLELSARLTYTTMVVVIVLLDI